MLQPQWYQVMWSKDVIKKVPTINFIIESLFFSTQELFQKISLFDYGRFFGQEIAIHSQLKNVEKNKRRLEKKCWMISKKIILIHGAFFRYSALSSVDFVGIFSSPIPLALTFTCRRWVSSFKNIDVTINLGCDCPIISISLLFSSLIGYFSTVLCVDRIK